MVNSPEQRRLRIRDSEELALADWLGSAAFDRVEDYRPRRWAEAYVHFAAGEQRSWLHGMGVRWFPLVQWAERGGYAQSRPRQLGSAVPYHVGHRPCGGRALRQRRDELTTRADPVPAPGHVAGGPTISGVRVSGRILAPTDVPRGVQTSRTAVGEFAFTAQAVVVRQRRDWRQLRPRSGRTGLQGGARRRNA